jgi:nuclear transport factor 2 (NTF2) superfamily protein
VARNPELVQFAYTPDSIWRNRDTFLQGREEIVEFLRKKWAKENGYRLRKELFAFTDDKVRALTPGSLLALLYPLT